MNDQQKVSPEELKTFTDRMRQATYTPVERDLILSLVRESIRMESELSGDEKSPGG